jgi:hypothetical protein
MERSTEIEFNVDEQYENEKGIFKVVSIHRDQMVIRWKDGEETRTDIALQRRIAERRQWDKNKRLTDIKAAQEARRKSASKNQKTVFTGIAASDFKNSCYRTTWRSRNQLGGSVTKRIKTDPFEFNSWAYGRQPEMHVQDISHHDSASPDDEARFFVRIDDQYLYYGFGVIRPDNRDGHPICWSALREWLIRKENQQAVHTLAINHNLTACNRTQPTACIKAPPEDGGWYFEDSEQPLPDPSLSAYFDRVPASDPCETELFAVLAKDDAVACGREIAPQIAQLFVDLLPLYQAATSHL